MFEKGTKWIRADYHLHTRADKEFTYSGDPDRFISDFVDKLTEQNIGLGVITNHNKFDLGEYKGIKKKAKNEGIIILPGVELSVKEGSNGIHCLIIFNDEEWIKGTNESINQFLDEVFKGINNRENENTRCNKDLAGAIECLNSYNKDYFIIMAHVEQKSGFFKECEGGLIGSLSSNIWFKSKVLAFQKGRTRDKMKKVKEWMTYEIPYVEASDCKSIDQIGKGKRSYIKIGDGSFDSILLSFKDFRNRLSLEGKIVSHGFIKSAEFIGGKLDSQKIFLSPELNCLIGIRGSGKSSVIEAIRYALDLPVSESDKSYKTDVVKNLLGSGGQIILKVQDDYQYNYTIKRILNETPHVLNEEGNDIGVKIDTVLKAPLYFGQKDLSSTDNGFELELLDKLVGQKKLESRQHLKTINEDLVKEIKSLFDLEDSINGVADLKTSLNDTQHKINTFEDKGVADKLSRQVNYQSNMKHFDNVEKQVSDYIEKINHLINSTELEELSRLKSAKSVESSELFLKLSKEIVDVIATKNDLRELKESITKHSDTIIVYKNNLQLTLDSLEEEFAEIKREINIPNLDPDDYGKLKDWEEKLTKSIDDASKREELKGEILTRIRALSSTRNDALLKEFNAYNEEIDKINNSQNSLQLSISFKGNKKAFLDKLNIMFRGSGITQSAYSNISERFPDFTALMIDVMLENSVGISELITDTQLTKIKEKIHNGYDEYIKIETPNLIEINYHGKPIIKHSIGQRASALVLFILTQKENNLIMIDQPEDDLDNQVIYKEIIKEIKLRKPDVQFLFATHNANIPVLGDSEQVISVAYDESAIELSTGSIDNKEIQKRIVDIMEGGSEAFNKRNEIYSLWK